LRPAYRVETVRAAERALMATLPDGALMQRAAAGLARRCADLLREAGGVYGAHVLLLVGSGDNGGDALYAGARLARRGARVHALLLTPERAHAGGLAALRSAGGRVTGAVPAPLDLVVDGIVGIGGHGGLRPAASGAVAAAALTGAPVVAVDVPSGVEADTGAVPGDAVRADVTVTFGCLKPGLVVGPGAARAGVVEVVDIGLGPYLRDPALDVPDAADIASRWPRPRPDDDKYTRGVVGIAAGSAQYPGAAVLAVGAALAGPAGMVRYAGHAADRVRAEYPEAVVTDSVARAGRVQAWAVGSGLGTDVAAAATLRRVLATDVPVLVDADALTLLAEHPGWVRDRAAPTVLTPHDREFQRLFGPVGEDRLGAAREAAARLRCTVLLKGDRTVVADARGAVYANPTGSAVLATAGSGDVLSGLGASILAAGVPAAEAAIAAAFVHGLAGRLAAAEGPVSAGRIRDGLRPAVRTVLGD
jgi:hydroxyethylthiazole kinase-like uncharacterized protein yjeF